MKQRKGIVLAGGTGSRLHPLTLAVSKQLMPVYDKPMVYYPLSVLMLANIREILIISTPHDLPAFERLLGSGEQFGVQFSYSVQESPDGLAQAFIIGEEFLAGAPSALVLGDNLFYGHNLELALQNADARSHATVFAYHVSNPSDYGVIEFDASGRAISIVEKPTQPRSNFAVPGMYFYDEHAPAYAREQLPSARGELEITDLNRRYLEEEKLQVEMLGRGTAWLDTGTHESLIEASSFVRTIQKRQGLQIACLEEIAFAKKWIGRDDLEKQIKALGRSTYSAYLRTLLAAESQS